MFKIFNRNSGNPKMSQEEAQKLLLEAAWAGNTADISAALTCGAEPNTADANGKTPMGQFVEGYTKFRIWDATGPKTARIEVRDAEYLGVAAALVQAGADLRPHGQGIRSMAATEVRQFLSVQYDYQIGCTPPSKPSP